MKITNCFGITSLTPLKNRKIDYIAVHYTAGVTSKIGSAVNLAKWYAAGSNPNNPTSSDFIIDDYTVVQYNQNISDYYTWGVGGAKYSRMSTSLGGRLYGKAKNSNTINIEVCSNKRDRSSLNADDKDWYFTDAEIDLLVDLVKYLMSKFNIDADHVIMHHEVTGKLCPAMWTHNDAELSAWYDFKKRISSTQGVVEAPKKLYRVQVGAYGVKANAENALKEVKKYFPDAYIKSD